MFRQYKEIGSSSEQNSNSNSQNILSTQDLYKKPIYTDTYKKPKPDQAINVSKAHPKSTLETYDMSKYPKLKDTCSIGTIEPLFSGDDIVETYCRCPTGTYGFTCLENIYNPCYNTNREQQYHEADSSLSKQYFLECNWNIPYLFKCPSDLIWNQKIKSCDYPYTYRPPEKKYEPSVTDSPSTQSYSVYSKPLAYYNYLNNRY